ncbi:MAG: hypothetical protein ACK50M_01565, partial [Cyclobacteriaceae bacterium]
AFRALTFSDLGFFGCGLHSVGSRNKTGLLQTGNEVRNLNVMPGTLAVDRSRFHRKAKKYLHYPAESA